MRAGKTLPDGLAGRCFTLLLTLTFLAVISACDRQQPGAPATANPTEIAGELIKRTIVDPGDGHVAIEVDHELLRELNNGANGEQAIEAFRDPLLAAWLFAPHIGVPTGAVISIEQVSAEAEEGSGLFIAVATANTADGPIRMRLVSEPDAAGQPTLWVLNDYDN